MNLMQSPNLKYIDNMVNYSEFIFVGMHICVNFHD